MLEDDEGEDLDIRAQSRIGSAVAVHVVNKTASLSPVREISVSNEAVLSSSSTSKSSSSSTTSVSALDSSSSFNSNQLQRVVKPVLPEGEHYSPLQFIEEFLTRLSTKAQM